MSFPPEQFAELLMDLDELSSKQTYTAMLHFQEIAAGDVNPLKEAIATFNALEEEEVIKFLRTIKKQFTNEDWETLSNL